MAETTLRSTSKRAIFDEESQEKLLAAADPELEWAPIWLMMRLGMHPRNVMALEARNLERDGAGFFWLQYRRAKNDYIRREQVGLEDGERLLTWLRRHRPKTHQGYYELVRRVGRRAGLGERITPMSLRHTACINFLRQYADKPDRVDMVAVKMGCNRETVMRNYVEMEDWERV